MAGSSPEAAAVERAWRCQPCGVQLAGRGEQGGFLDLVDRPLLAAVLDPTGAAAGADGDRVQTEADGDQGRSAQRAAWHQRTSARLLGCGGGYLRTGRPALGCRGTQLGGVSSLFAPALLVVGASVRPRRIWMRLGVASSALGTRICSTPSSNEAWIPSASTWAGRVIARRKAP